MVKAFLKTLSLLCHIHTYLSWLCLLWASPFITFSFILYFTTTFLQCLIELELGWCYILTFSYCVLSVVVELLVCNSPTNTTCLFYHSEVFNVSSNGGWWIIGPLTVYYVVFILSVIILLEFVWAQSPRPFCELLTGIIIMSIALSAVIGYGFCKIVVIMISTTHGWFCSNLSIAFIMFVYFVCFYCISKQYKLRKRDDIVPIHLFAEDYFEKEIRGRQRLDKV